MISLADAGVVAVVVGAVSVAGVAAGTLLLRLLRRRTIWASTAVVLGTAGLVMAAGVLALSHKMLLTAGAFRMLLVAVLTATLAGSLVAAALARRLARGSAGLRHAAGLLGAGEPLTDVPDPDTRELRALAEALRAASGRLADAREREQAVEAARRELVAWVSHDLRSPVAGIRAMAEALEDGVVCEPADVADYHRRMRREAVRLAAMIDDLFELSGIHAGALVVRARPTELREVVGEALGGVEPLAAARGLTLDASALSDAAVLVDPDQLVRALRNLLGNAVRHSEPGGTVTVECGPEGDGAVVRVTDTCGGIPETDLARLFEVGFRGQWARTPGDDVGAGLGLAIAQGILDAHGGTITARNVEGGCRFTVRLPPGAERGAPALPATARDTAAIVDATSR
ncbi:sensor histidine kinase KdpD [Cellulomonas cellasea]|uniref:histidine kinase n=1 Tax=Cellulomonas cellasea TaxID=43670 RepID=A0A7W4UDK3_9CELL|nr:HAMP domain-containing sensor histidine kinase [Cellulomonas cellasea]MBB2922199.1 signal transduction histidine kinase [Cellulomonas cellasea]